MGNINELDNIMFENQKKRNMEIKKYFYINPHLKGRLDRNAQLAMAS